MTHKALTGVLAVSALMLPATAADAGACSGADASIASAGAAAQAHAMRCLINSARGAHALPRLRASASLDRAATRHSSDMVRRRYFDHTSPGGGGLKDRVRRAGYRATHLGEAIAYGGGPHATAAATVRGWLDSRPHRRILLDPDLRDIGIGVAAGAPGSDAGEDWITVTANLGRR